MKIQMLPVALAILVAGSLYSISAQESKPTTTPAETPASARPREADPQLAATARAVPAQIEAVTSGGYWKRDGHDGSFRLLIESVGWDEITSRVFLQWLRLDPDKQEQIIERTVPIKEIAGKWRVVSQKFVLRGKQWDVVVSAERRDPKAAATFTISPAADYSYTIATSEK